MKKQAFCVKLERVPGLSRFRENLKLYVQENSHMGTLNTSRKFNPQHFAEAGGYFGFIFHYVLILYWFCFHRL